MAATSLGEVYSRRSFSDSGINDRSATRVFRVQTTTADVTGAEIAAATGVVRGSVFPGDLSLFCTSCSISSASEKGDLWEVSFDYSNASAASDPDVGVADPTQRRVRVIPSYVAYEHVITKTVDDPPRVICNSVGDRFADPVTETRYHRRLTIIRNETNLPAIEPYIGKVNSKPFLGYPAGAVKLTLTEPGELAFEGEYRFYPYGYIFDIRPGATPDVSPWDKEILDAGTYELDDDGIPIPILDKYGTPVTEPRNLGGDGKQLEDQSEQVFLVFKVAERIDFNDLNIELP